MAVKNYSSLIWLDMNPGDTYVFLDLDPVISKTCKTPLRVQRSQHLQMHWAVDGRFLVYSNRFVCIYYIFSCFLRSKQLFDEISTSWHIDEVIFLIWTSWCMRWNLTFDLNRLVFSKFSQVEVEKDQEEDPIEPEEEDS